jgi:hypothetical protein
MLYTMDCKVPLSSWRHQVRDQAHPRAAFSVIHHWCAPSCYTPLDVSTGKCKIGNLKQLFTFDGMAFHHMLPLKYGNVVQFNGLFGV